MADQKQLFSIVFTINHLDSSNKYTSNDVRVVSDCLGVFEVKGKEVIYTVNFGIKDGMMLCSCKDWISRHIPCKHSLIF